jgi:hypothetical protein
MEKRMHTRVVTAVFVMACVTAPGRADPPRPLGGIATRLGCSMRAYIRCAGEFCYDSQQGETTGTTGVAGANSWAFGFDFKDNTASVGEDYAKNHNKRWPIKGLEESRAVVNEPMFVKFNVLTDTQKLFVMIVATPLPEAKGYSFGYGVVSRHPHHREPFPSMDKTINSGKCTVE